MSNTPKLSWFIWGTLRLYSIRTESPLANRLPAWRINNRRNKSFQFDRINSNRQHFQPTLQSPPEVNIHEITIHEPSSFLKHGHKLQSICTIPVDSIESTWIWTLKVQINNIFQVLRKSTSGMSNRQKGKRFVSIPWNRVHESISRLSNRNYQRRIDSSWVYWTTLAAHVPTAFLVLPNFHSCFYNSIETWYMFSISQITYSKSEGQRLKSNNWRGECKRVLSDDFVCVCVFFSLKSAWIFACGFQLNRKTSPCIFFRWFALRFREITLRKTSRFLPASFVARETKEVFCFAEQWNQWSITLTASWWSRNQYYNQIN